EIRTPVALAHCRRLADPRPIVVPILRAGLGMLEGMTRLLPTAEVGFLGMRRDDNTLEIETYANRLPDDLSGRQCFVLAVDARRSGDHRWEVDVNGGRTPTGIDCLEWVKHATELGAGEILLTSMDADGTKSGYDIELTRTVSEAVDVPVIASGGAGKLEHFYDVLTEGKADAVLAASVFHYGTFTVREVKEYLKSRGVEVRF
ncbi:HisA/HisF-related TIM barrel protein, partial [uncultured Selenomonas sp.]|uniref:HisA/HisF-related TIM barrel protein n=1 Tax=uncultured Selenomonas sp. TaxID=159275 RepID=UPI0025841EEB